MPRGHGVQTLDEFAASVVENLPASHPMQSSGASLPVVGAYVPARQASQKAAEYAPGVLEYLPVSCVWGYNFAIFSDDAYQTPSLFRAQPHLLHTPGTR